MYDINGNEINLGQESVYVDVEHGGIGNGPITNTLANIDKTFRTKHAIKVEPASNLDIDIVGSAGGEISVVEYASDYSYIKKTASVSGSLSLSATTHYVMCGIIYSQSGQTPRQVEISSTGNITIVKKIKSRQGFEKFIYEVSSGIYGSGVLMLPPNYTPDGESVPLLVYIHGSNGFADWNTDMGVLVSGNTYYQYMEYLRDEGFAILDVYGWTSKYLDIANQQNMTEHPNKSNTWGCPITYKAYLEGIKYVLDCFNVNKVSAYCKSLGGELAKKFAYTADIDFSAICCLAPSADAIRQNNDWGHSPQGREILADSLGFTGDVEGVFLQEYFDMTTTDGLAFMNENLPKLAGWNPAWSYMGRTLEQKFSDSMSADSSHTELWRKVLHPVKIWCAPDDTAVSYNKNVEYVEQAKNGGCDVLLRTMPTGTGGHHSVDSDPNAPKQDITTVLGITHTGVPVAYVEMVDFIRSRQ